MRHAFVMRGIPGSGKTETAKMIASGNDFRREFVEKDGVVYCIGREPDEYELNFDEILPFAAIHSTDQYFIKDGVYKYNPKKQGKYHNQNFKAFRDSLELGIGIVICDNTNIEHKDYERYVRAAKNEGYIVSVVTMPAPSIKEAVERNTHNLPRGTLEQLIKKWQH